jgi:predicted flap endonuclease-1-like 5' DNA nuclease
MPYKVIEIEGVGTASAAKLAAVGVRSTEQLLEKAVDRKGRKVLAEAAGVREEQVLKWANHADLMRIKGVATQMAELLEAAGVDTVKELRTRSPEALAQKMAEVNAAKNLTHRSPTAKQCKEWIEQAKTLEAILTY